MVALSEIQQFSQALVREFHPQRVILFGSYARGTADEHSDVDLLVVMPHEGSPVKKSVEIRLRIRPPFPLDILVRSPKKVRQRLAMGDSFMREILEEGKTLYEASDG